jgi:hypothetical protein
MSITNLDNEVINNTELTDISIEDLDTLWIEEFENLDNEYKSYYTEELTFIKVHYIYINIEDTIEKIKEEKIIFKQPGILQKEELLSIIKHNSILNDTKYSLLSILKYNINLEPINLKTFLRNNDANVGDIFLQSIKNIDTIKFDKTISMFQDINDIFILFHQKKCIHTSSSKSNKLTKKQTIGSNKKTKKRT